MDSYNVINWTRVNNTTTGHPRYVCSWLNFGTKTYAEAITLANKIGGKKYDTKEYAGGIVINTFKPNETEKQINHLLSNPHLYVKYTGVIFFVHSLYIDKNGQLVKPTFEERMLDQFKPEDQQEYSLIQFSEILGRVYVEKQYQLVEAAIQYAKDNDLQIDYGIACVKNP
jgi:hypothetical protein